MELSKFHASTFSRTSLDERPYEDPEIDGSGNDPRAGDPGKGDPGRDDADTDVEERPGKKGPSEKEYEL